MASRAHCGARRRRGPLRSVLVDIDAHHAELPPRLATGLLPGIDLAAEPIPACEWNDPARFRDGRDTLTLLARLRGGPRPWPPGPEHRPVTAATPSGGVHLWYQAPVGGLRQVLSDPGGRYGLAWQIDIKAGWSYGVAPGAATSTATYQLRDGDPVRLGRMPPWLAREVTRAAIAQPPQPAFPPPSQPGGSDPAAYLTTVISRGAIQLAAMSDGRKRALSALAYHVGGLLAWSGLNPGPVARQLADAGTAAGLQPSISVRIVKPCHRQRNQPAGNPARLPLLTARPPEGLPMSASEPHPFRDKLTVDDICTDLDISRRTFYEWRAKGTAPKCIKLPNGELRIYHTEYRRWLDAREDAA